MSKFHKTVGVGAILCALSCTDCKLFQSACSAAMPMIVKSQALSADAASALQQLQMAFSVIQLPAETRKEVDAGFERAWGALRAADALLVTASSACTAPDISAVFADFAQAWAVLKALVPLVAEKVGAANLVKSPVADPIVVGMVRKAK